MRRRRLLLIAGGLGGLGLIGWNVKGSTMQEIRFELGRNIVETARRSGVPRFSVAKTSTLIDYSVNSIPPGIPARYTRPGYEVVWEPLYGFMMFANERYGSDLAVHYASLQLANSIRSHAEAQAFVEKTIAQFQQGRWQRYFHDELPRLTGRSSYLDEHDKIDAFSIDPNYKIPVEEWTAVAESRANWHWIGEGVLAELSVSYRVDSETRQPIYSMDLTFENETIKNRYMAENKARELKEGDAKGWNSTARAVAEKQFVIEQNKRLEQKAIERGDSWCPGRNGQSMVNPSGLAYPKAATQATHAQTRSWLPEDFAMGKHGHRNALALNVAGQVKAPAGTEALQRRPRTMQSILRAMEGSNDGRNACAALLLGGRGRELFQREN